MQGMQSMPGLLLDTCTRVSLTHILPKVVQPLLVPPASLPHPHACLELGRAETDRVVLSRTWGTAYSRVPADPHPTGYNEGVVLLSPCSQPDPNHCAY